MGIATKYIIYKAIKNRAIADERQRVERETVDFVCDQCGYALSDHSDEPLFLCPE